ncbi:MAG: molybdopterin molybdotransferase [Acidobacteriota bacterium]|nr:molybdopterin molybdotransferase [Acidobacteriota bacterium]
MLPVIDAITIVERETPHLATEEVALRDARGRVLAEDVVADTDLPPFDRALMDGYAVRAGDTEIAPATLRVVGESAAGRGWRGEMRSGEAVRIMTGAPVPAGADSVQQVELTREIEDGARVVIDKATKSGQFISRRATEVKRDEVILRAGERVSPAMLAALASFGYARVKVAKRPRVSVLATGTELVRVEETPGADSLRDSNTYSLIGYAEAAGALAQPLPFAADDEDLLRGLIAEAADTSDALVLSGGVSMGAYDFTKSALVALGAEIFFDRVSLRPGKPTVFARLPNARRTLVFGLPGNPVSVSVTFNLFARTSILAMQGANATRLVEHHAVLARNAKGSIERASYLPATLHTDKRGQLLAEPLKWRGSSDFVAFTRATALVIIPEGVREIEAGAIVNVLKLPE